MSATSTSPSAELGAGRARHVLLWGTYDTSKPRIRILRDAVRSSGARLDEIHAGVWEAVADKSQLRGISAPLSILWRMLRAYPLLLWRLCRAQRPDVVMVSYPGLVDVVLASWIGRWRRIPVCLDVFISLYDTVVLDRRMLAPDSLAARVLFRLEQWSLRHARYPFMDTATHALRIESMFGLPDGSMGSVWVGAEADRFPTRQHESHPSATALKVLFYGQFIPLHGIATIIAAAELLRDAEVDWLIIGQGQETQRINALLEASPLPRVRCLPWVAYEELVDHLQKADVCLGIFGTSAKAASVIPNKIYQIIAAGRPFITRDSAAIRELVTPCDSAVLVPPGDAWALADAVIAMKASTDTHRACHTELRARISAARIAGQFHAMLDGTGTGVR